MVQDVSFRSGQKVYVVSTTGRSGRKEYRCSEDHVLSIEALERPGSSSGPRKRISVRKEISVGEFLGRGKEWRSKARIFTTPPFDLPEAEVPLHPHTLGVILGDGCLTQLDYSGSRDALTRNPVGYSASISSPEALLKVLCDRHEWGDPIKIPDRNSFRVTIPEGPVKLGLRQLHLVQVGSYEKFVPEEYRYASLEQRLELLAGLVDTDGTHEQFSTVNLGLAEAFHDLVYSIGGTANVVEKEILYKGAAHLSFIVHYSTGEYLIPTVLEHKRRKPRDFTWKNPRNTSFVIKPDGLGDVYGLVLEGSAHRYITDDYLVTSSLGCASCQAEHSHCN